MYSGRWTTHDQRLADSDVFAGRPQTVALLAGGGAAALLGGVLLALLGARSPGDALEIMAVFGLIAAGFMFAAFAYWRTRLVVGSLGFRFEWALRPLQASRELPWGEVSGCEVGYGLFKGPTTWLTVTRTDGSTFTVRREFSASWYEICNLMEDRRKVYEAAHPGERSETRS